MCERVKLYYIAYTHFLSTISDAPLVNNRYPPPGRGITVLIDLRTELNVNTRVNLSSVMSSRID